MAIRIFTYCMQSYAIFRVLDFISAGKKMLLVLYLGKIHAGSLGGKYVPFVDCGG